MKTKSKNPGAGLGDPYWYEWSIGLEYVLDLLDTKKNVSSVTLQKSGTKGLDDVVVAFSNGQSRFIQVKHTRAGDALTFGDVVTGEEKEDSLLKYMAAGWVAAGKPSEVWLVTNREAGTQKYTPSGSNSISRPPLAEFINWLETESRKASDLSDLKVKPEWKDAWEKLWLAEIGDIKTDTDKLAFLKALAVRHSEPELSAVRTHLLKRIEALFMVPGTVSAGLLARLDSALRIWATSDRGTVEAITREVVYEKLCLEEDVIVGDHDFAPPAPFFPSRLPAVDGVVAILRKRECPIVFVTGEPGSGKTALLSYLANQRDPIIGARFHAYRPITPENQLLPTDSEVTKPRVLWSDLLIKLRPLARGRLFQLQVPIHAGSLTIEALRGHVLRIANALGETEGRPFVIAIDGIDHAARSGERTTTFLASLVPPNEVPEHVVFLIGGQPTEGYQRHYPTWLRAGAEGVATYSLPRLELADTKTLVGARLAIKGTVTDAVARDVHAACEGHTLSTVFAVEEAVLLGNDLDRLAARLADRKLTSGVEGYYESIWAATTQRFLGATALRLAACLVLARSRTNADMVRAVVDPASSVPLNWKDVLRELRPLVVEEPSGFRVFHNDFRVFLHGLLQGDSSTYKECASLLGDYLMDGDDRLARHAGAQALYGIAGRRRNQAALFTPYYVLEGNAIGRRLSELTEQAVVAAEALSGIDIDWNLAHQVTTGLKTLDQLRASLQWRDGLEGANTVHSGTIAPRAVERTVPPRTDWTHERVVAAIGDVLELCGLNEAERARAAFGRWFTGLSPKEVADLAELDAGTHEHQRQEATRTLFAALGRASVTTNDLLERSSGTERESAEAEYARGLLDAADKSAFGDRAFAAILLRIQQVDLGDVEKLLWRLIERREWRRCGLVLQALRSRDGQPWSFRLSSAVAAAILGDANLQTRWTSPILIDRDGAIAASVDHLGAGIDEPSRTIVMARLALLFGLTEPNRDASALREEIETVYHARDRRDERHDPGVAELLHAAALLGSLIRSTREGRRSAIHCDATTVARTVSTLVTAMERHPYRIPFGYPQIASSIVKGILDCSSKQNDLFVAICPPLLDRMAQRKSLGPMLTPVWRFLAKAPYHRELLSYADAWIGSEGEAWTLSPAERHEFVSEFASLLAEIDELGAAELALKRLPWTNIGYTGHKDSSLNQALEWFRELAGVDSRAWEDEGLRLLTVSREASRIGDNRVGGRIDRAVLSAACLDGPAAIARIALAERTALAPGDDAIVYALLHMLKTKTLQRSELLSIWAFCVGQHCWRVPADRQVLADVRDAILAAAGQGDIRDLDRDMRRVGRAEFACEHEPDTSSPPIERETPDYSVLKPADAIHLALAHRDWKQVAASLRDAKAQGAASYAECVDQAWTALKTREEQIWWFDGANQVYELLFPLVSASQKWQAVSHTVLADHFSSTEARLQTVQDNLNAMCLLVASQAGALVLRAGLARLVDMHVLWAEGGGHLPRLISLNVEASSALTTWSQVFQVLLLRLLQFDEQSYAQSALRGIFALLRITPELLPELLERLLGSPERVVRRFMLIADALVVEGHGDVLREWLERVMAKASRLDIALSAWGALVTAARASGRNDPVWPEPTGQRQIIVAVSPLLIAGTSARNGLNVSAARSSLSFLRFLEAACEESVDDVASEFASSIRDDPPPEDESQKRTRGVGDYVLSSRDDAETGRLFEVLRTHERRGRFVDTTVDRLAQALVPAADPFVFLRTPSIHPQAESWPVDSKLDDRMSDPAGTLIHDLVAFLRTDLPKDRRVIGGSVATYSGKWDVKILMHHRFPTLFGGGLEPPKVLNGRASLLRRDFQMIVGPGSGDEWLTWGVSGLFPFIDGVMDIFPSPRWRLLGWEPSPSDPTRWTREGTIVAWYEQLLGPVRRVYGGDLIHRHPGLARWVCSLGEWNRLCRQFGQPEPRFFPARAPYNSQ